MMQTLKKYVSVAFLALFVMGAPLTALAQKELSQAEATQKAVAAFGGEVLSAQKSGTQYRIKLLSKGTVRIVVVDAKTGQVVSE